MANTFSDVADFAASLSLIFVLAVAYSALHRRMRGGLSPRFVLGVLFGIVAMLEMQRPLQPFDGVLIDMRNIPIALAGAFLGKSGLAATLIIAVISRIYLGGAGALAGVVGMGVAGGLGYLWHRYSIRADHRHFGHMCVLAALMSIHVATGLLLPAPAMTWFFEEAAAPLVAVNMLVIPLAAWVLERERVLIRKEDALKDAARVHPETGLLTWPQFRKEVAFRMTAAPAGEVSGLVEIRLEHRDWLDWIWGIRDNNWLLGAIRVRLVRWAPGTDCVGLLPHGGVALPLTADLAAQPVRTAQAIQALIEREAFSLPGGVTAQVQVRVLVHQATSHQAMAALFETLTRVTPQQPMTFRKPLKPQAASYRKGPVVPDAQADLLFEKAALLMSTRTM